MAEGSVGDRLIVQSEKVGRSPREGEIKEVLAGGSDVHYRVLWADGHESFFYPGGGSTSIVHKKAKGKTR
jgi:hypothetical protein